MIPDHDLVGADPGRPLRHAELGLRLGRGAVRAGALVRASTRNVAVFGGSYQDFFDSQMSGTNRPQERPTGRTRTWPPVATVVMLAAQ